MKRPVRVAITRPRDQADDMVQAVLRLGGEPLCFPLIDIVTTLSDAFLTALREPVDLLVFTSARGIAAYLTGCTHLGLQMERPPAICVGEQTARAAAQAGMQVVAIPEVAAADSLPAVVDQHRPQPGRLLLVQGRLADPALSSELAARGWDVVRAVGYDTQMTPEAASCVQAVRLGEVDVLTFASGSAVRAFASAAKARAEHLPALVEGVIVASIGPKTTQVLAGVGLVPQVTASAASGSALIEAVFAYVHAR